MSKALTGAERVRQLGLRYRKAGLKQIKLWMHPGDAASTRAYVDRKPKTKAARAAARLKSYE